MQNERILSFLGLCKKAGKLCLGFDCSCEKIKNKEAKLILFTKDISERSEKSILKFAKEFNIKYKKISIYMHQIGDIFGKQSGIICIIDQGFAAKIETLIEL